MKIPRRLLDDIIDHARADAPNECCGMIAASGGRAVAVHRARNAAASPLRYELDGMEQYRIQTAIEDAGHDLGAIYHSHTRSAPYPSQTDINLAFYPESLYVIVGVAEAEPDVRASRSSTAGSPRPRSRSRTSRSRGRGARLPGVRDGAGRPRALLPGLRPAARPRRRPDDRSRSPSATPVPARSSGSTRRAARPCRAGAPPGRGRAHIGAAARGGGGERVAALGGLRRARLPRRRPAGHPGRPVRPRGRPRRAAGGPPSEPPTADRVRDRAPLWVQALAVVLVLLVFATTAAACPDRRGRGRGALGRGGSAAAPARRGGSRQVLSVWRSGRPPKARRWPPRASGRPRRVRAPRTPPGPPRARAARTGSRRAAPRRAPPGGRPGRAPRAYAG
jgi:proteasome lid subunit RPN8/RPN11